MELRHLRYFVAVAEELSFTRAAVRVRIAQPPLSQQIRQLEEELGVILLERGARPLRLTEAGLVLLDRARALLAAFDAAIAETRRAGRGQTAKLGIGFAGSAMFIFVPDVIRAFRDVCPDVELVLDEMLAAEIAEALRQRKIDVGFARPPLLPEGGLAQSILLEEPYLAALPESHPLASRTEIALAELGDDPFILYPAQPGPSVTTLIATACTAAGFTPRIVQEAMHLQTVVSLVAAGAGVSLVPAAAARGQARRGVAYIPLLSPAPTAPLAVAWREGDIAPALARFLAIVDGQREYLA
jgi:DNA-binding transcriptional LysR family regulator